MKPASVLIVLFNLSAHLLFPAIPLSSAPTWTSSDNDYSTGGALYDVTMDGWVDFCMGNGNDMASNRNAVYVNTGGALETIASWRSIETGYYSHVYVGDVNNDGFPDLAVAYLGAGFPNQGPATLYLNTGTGLANAAAWSSADDYNSFDCALGDIDLDGDLDLATVAGDPYNNIYSPTRVYRNHSGTLETTPSWTSTDTTPGSACRWIDINNDGDLDLVVGYRRKLAVFTNTGNSLEAVASWSVAQPGWILRLAVGDYDRDGYQDVAAACNGQLSGDISRIEIYRNQGGTLGGTAQYVFLTSTDYCSCVEWGDVNNDSWPDLAAGGWWEPVVVFENSGGTFSSTPAWSWSNGNELVCETVTWGDVDNSSIAVPTAYFSGNGNRRLFYLPHRPIQDFQEVRVNDTTLALADYAFDPLAGWLSLKNAPPIGTDNVAVTFSYARYPDLGLTNWDPNSGNYIFSNTTGIEETAGPAADFLRVYPNPFKDQLAIEFRRAAAGHHGAISIYNAAGVLVKTLPPPGRSTLIWNGTDDCGRRVPAGVYFINAGYGAATLRVKVLLMR